jgi:hypothetical protein
MDYGLDAELREFAQEQDLDALFNHFGESFEIVEVEYEEGVAHVTFWWNMMVERAGLAETIRYVQQSVRSDEGWQVADLQLINQIADKPIFGV